MIVKDPRLRKGPCQRARGDSSDKGVRGKIRKSAVVFMGGLLFGYFLFSQVLVTKANGPSVSTNTEVPDQIIEYCELVGSEYNICPELLESIAYRESRFIPTVTNGNCVGLCQVNIKVHADRIEKYGWTEDDMTDPYKNLMVAGDYLRDLYKTYGDENPIVLAAYSGNSKAISKYKEYGIMCDYAEDILTRSAEYERLHNK